MRSLGLTATGAAAILCTLLIARTAFAGCTITVNTSSNGFVNHDAFMTLTEATAIGAGVNCCNTCMTAAEKAQIQGATFSPPHLPGDCGGAVPPDLRYDLINGCGGTLSSFPQGSSADNINFSNAVVGPIAVGVSSGVGLVVDKNDNIDGLKPDGGRVELVGPGRNSSAGDGILVNDLNTGNQFRNLIIHGFNGNGIRMTDPNGAVIEGIEAYDNSGSGIRLGDGAAGHVPQNNRIGGTAISLTQQMFLYDNGSGITIDAGNSNSQQGMGNVIQNSFIGLIDEIGTGNHGNAAYGILLNNVSGTQIGGASAGQPNYIGHNGIAGILIAGNGSRFNTMQGNYIGLPRDIFTARPNADGIVLTGGANQNTIGGDTPSKGNVVSGNTSRGVVIGGGDANVVQGNLIGLKPTADVALHNGGNGVEVSTGATNTHITGNIIAGNTGDGLLIRDAGTTGTAVDNNSIGVDSFGAFANATGVHVDFNSAGNTIGPNNTLSGNAAFGVMIASEGADNNVIKGNLIGLFGVSIFANGSGGVAVMNGADNTLIGGFSVADRNIIAGNSGAGIQVNGATTIGTQIRGDYIGTNSVGTGPVANSAEGIAINQANATEVRNCLISGNGNDGVKLLGATLTALTGNKIGTNVSATSALPNAFSGIAVFAAANTNSIGDPNLSPNFIGGNGSNGVYISDNGTQNNVVVNNVIGGNAALANHADGILIQAGASNNQITGNVIGANTGPGVDLAFAGTSANLVRGNYIGVDASGNIAIPNGIGVRIFGGASNNTIGGVNAADSNHISGNNTEGVGIYNSGSTGNLVRGNLIGTNGTGAVPNTHNGVVIQEGASANTIRLNVISGNLMNGVFVQNSGTSNNSFFGNTIGANSAGTSPLPNQGDGIQITNGASLNRIGSGSTVDGNRILFNLGSGVRLINVVDNSIQANAISGNGGLGIDRNGLGVTPNVSGGGDNFPLISNAVEAGGSVSMTLSLNYPFDTQNAYDLDAFQNTTCDTSGNGEGKTWLGTVTLFTGQGVSDGSVNAMFPFPSATALVGTATSTDVTNLGTSEFSPCSAIGNDGIFFNGFEIPPPAPLRAGQSPEFVANASIVQPGLAMRASTHTLSSGKMQVEVIVANNSRKALPAQVVSLGASTAVTVGAMQATTASCVLHGLVQCSIPPLAVGATEQIQVTLRSASAEGFDVSVQSRMPSGIVWQDKITYDPPAAK